MSDPAVAGWFFLNLLSDNASCSNHWRYKGFDPIFWLHHCQVDRLMSLWSAMHPGVWVSEVRGLNKDTGSYYSRILSVFEALY